MNFLRKYYRRWKKYFSPYEDDIVVLNTAILFAMFFPNYFLILITILAVVAIIDQILDNP